jgi:hypothetical protein
VQNTACAIESRQAGRQASNKKATGTTNALLNTYLCGCRVAELNVLKRQLPQLALRLAAQPPLRHASCRRCCWCGRITASFRHVVTISCCCRRCCHLLLLSSRGRVWAAVLHVQAQRRLQGLPLALLERRVNVS